MDRLYQIDDFRRKTRVDEMGLDDMEVDDVDEVEWHQHKGQ